MCDAIKRQDSDVVIAALNSSKVASVHASFESEVLLRDSLANAKVFDRSS